jgi:hypothetical protein
LFQVLTRQPTSDFFTEGNEGNEGFSQIPQMKQNLPFIRVIGNDEVLRA